MENLSVDKASLIQKEVGKEHANTEKDTIPEKKEEIKNPKI